MRCRYRKLGWSVMRSSKLVDTGTESQLPRLDIQGVCCNQDQLIRRPLGVWSSPLPHLVYDNTAHHSITGQVRTDIHTHTGMDSADHGRNTT